MENSWKTASIIGTLLSTQVPVPMIPWVRLQSKPILILILITWSKKCVNGKASLATLQMCSKSEGTHTSWDSPIQQHINNVKLLWYFFAIIANIFCQPAIRLNRSCCPPDVVLLPASEQFYMTFNFQWWQPTLATLWVETPQIPQQLSVNTLMSTFSLILYCLEWTVTLYCHILSMASAQNTFCLIENQDNGKDCTGPCSKCRYMIGPSGH